VNGIPGGDTTNGFICPVGIACSGGNKISASGVGSPTGDVDYVAPANVPAGGVVTILMQSQADTSKSASAQATIVAKVSVNVSPASGITLPPSQTQQFTANVVGTSNIAVTWDVNGIGNGNSTVGQICQVGIATCTLPTAQNSNIVEYRAPAVVPSPATVTVTATSLDDPAQSAGGSVTISNGPFIQKLLPASITALPANGNSFTLKVQGINFTTSSVILFTPTGATTKQLTTTCTATPSECTATISVTDVGAANRPPHPAVQIQNPGNVTSNAVNLIVLDPATEQKDFASAPVVALNQSCTTLADGGCQNIIVVEPTTMGSVGAAGQVNFNLIGLFSGSNCLASNSPINVVRPTSSFAVISICVFGTTNFSATDKFTISGPNPNDISVVVDSSQAFPSVTVKLNLTIPFDAKSGPRTLFVETTNREKSAFVGAIEVK
jgi:hypothetical protein